MRRLILSDIHANLPAFESVLVHAGQCDEIIFLGDLANLGPHPGECIDLMRELQAVCIMGNHDLLISKKNEERNSWDEWSRNQLNDEQLSFLQGFKENIKIDDNIFALHGSYSVSYDILPNTPVQHITDAFSSYINNDIKMVLFGHYHYQVDVLNNGIEYHCIRPVGHHRDKDIRAGYSILEDGILTHYRVPYDIEKTVNDVDKIDCLDDSLKLQWKNFLHNAFDEKLLEKDLLQMEKNRHMAN